jgi:hypothetical protein
MTSERRKFTGAAPAPAATAVAAAAGIGEAAASADVYLHLWVDKYEPEAASFRTIEISAGPFDGATAEARAREMMAVGYREGAYHFPPHKIRLVEFRSS